MRTMPNPGERRMVAGSQPPGPGVAGRMLRWSASRLYSHTPLGSMARWMANRYTRSAAKSGLRALQLRRRQDASCQIFMYHRVNDQHDPYFYALPVAQFRAQMEYLARNFRFVTLDELGDGNVRANGRKFNVAITFDDGYRDNFLYAFPILKEMGIPATIFVATGYVESGQLPWYDRVRLAFKSTRQSAVALPGNGARPYSLETETSRLNALARSLDLLRGVDEAARARLLEELFKKLDLPANLELPHTMLTWDEILSMRRQGISFGAHTITHPVLATLSKCRMEEEIKGSKKVLEDRLQSPVRHFAYPFGKPSDFGPEAKGVVQAAGFSTAVTTVIGVNSPAQDRFELKRFSLREPDWGLYRLKLDWYRMCE